MKLIFSIMLALSLCAPTLAATCYGEHDCRACHTCAYCAHCNSSAKDKCDVFYTAQGLTPPWLAKRAAKHTAHHAAHRRHAQ